MKIAKRDIHVKYIKKEIKLIPLVNLIANKSNIREVKQ